MPGQTAARRRALPTACRRNIHPERRTKSRLFSPHFVRQGETPRRRNSCSPIRSRGHAAASPSQLPLAYREPPPDSLPGADIARLSHSGRRARHRRADRLPKRYIRLRPAAARSSYIRPCSIPPDETAGSSPWDALRDTTAQRRSFHPPPSASSLGLVPRTSKRRCLHHAARCTR